MPIPNRIFVVSDGTGETAEHVLRATLMQFQNVSTDMLTFNQILSHAQIEEVLHRAQHYEALVVYTMVDPDNRDYLASRAMDLDIPAVDLIGTLMFKLQSFLGQAPSFLPGILYKMNEDYMHRIDAVEFAVKNDDGQNPRNLKHAQIVLTGVSRTSKTPLSTYLAHKGLRVANVPLVYPIEPPEELFLVDPAKVFALEIDLDALYKIRSERLRHMGLAPTTDYAARDKILRELEWARNIFKQHPQWYTLNVTSRAIEETAALILKVRSERESSEHDKTWAD